MQTKRNVISWKFVVVIILLLVSVFTLSMNAEAKSKKKKKVTIRFYSTEGVEYTQYRRTVKKGKKISLPDVPEFDHVCYGWSTKKNGKGKHYKSWTSQSFKKNTKLYAMVWNENVRKTAKQTRIFETAKGMHETMVRMNTKNPGLWQYSSTDLADTFDDALNTGKYRVDCTKGVSWLLKRAGISSKRDYKVINYKGKKTVKQLLYSGKLKCGDKIVYSDLTHTNLYLGQNMWFDTGRYYVKLTNGATPFYSWIGDSGLMKSKVSKVYSLKP